MQMQGGMNLHFSASMVQYVMILLNGGTPIVFAGTEESSAYGEMIAIGGLGPSVNGKLSSTIAEILQTKLHIDSSRFYIKFYDVQASFSRPSKVLSTCIKGQIAGIGCSLSWYQ